MSIPVSHGVASSEIADRIARAAARLFASEGYDATSVRNIVEAAAVTKPTLYYYFESKELLAQRLLTDALDNLAVGLRQILAGPGTATEKLVALVEEHFRLCREQPDLARFTYAVFFGPRNSHLSAMMADLGQHLAELVASVVGGLATERIIAAERIEECTAAVRGLVAIYTMDYLYRDLNLDAGLARRLVTDLLDGFADHARRSLSESQRN
ncbi:MAG TPA: TetR/AcrR family transcriptional regulator [Pirellulales bacterium]|nr:TetR/AcrR family transcriptional regulator [Pirellulales bacterium]